MDQAEARRIYGVYTITCTVNGRQYVGSSGNVHRRWGWHRSLLRYGRHYNPDLQADWAAYGRPAFEFRVIGESRERAMRLAMEQAALDAAIARGLSYNLSPSAYSPKGYKWTPAQRQTLSAERTGKPLSPEHRAGIGIARSAAWATMDAGEKRERMAAMGRGNLGRPKSAEHRANIAAAHAGVPLSAEHRARLSESHMGNRNRVKMTEDTAREIKRRTEAGEKPSAIAASLPGVTVKMARDIKVGKTWKDI